jgi:Acetyltransferase (GNAT) domain
MLRGEFTGLRARHDSDIPALHAELYDDVETRVSADSRLLPAFRGRGPGTDAVRVLCHYGFAIRGLHRLQAETLAGNDAMIQAASRAGFAREGTLRHSAWVNSAQRSAI